MAVGATGVGKSTLLNAIIQGSSEMEMDDDCNIKVKQGLTWKDEDCFTIGHNSKSCT